MTLAIGVQFSSLGDPAPRGPVAVGLPPARRRGLSAHRRHDGAPPPAPNGNIDPIHPAGLAIFIGICLMSVVVAKSFCSHVCPVGLISELLGRLGIRVTGRTLTPPKWLDIPLRGLKYLLLGFFAWAIWWVMDPAAIESFLESPYAKIVDAKMWLFFASPSRLTIAVLGVLVVGSIFVRDLWCRYLCPYGALVGMLGILAPLKVTRDDLCTDCECTRVCPARLPVHGMKRVASVECTCCQDCVVSCPVERLPRRPAAARRGRKRLDASGASPRWSPSVSTCRRHFRSRPRATGTPRSREAEFHRACRRSTRRSTPTSAAGDDGGVNKALRSLDGLCPMYNPPMPASLSDLPLLSQLTEEQRATVIGAGFEKSLERGEICSTRASSARGPVCGNRRPAQAGARLAQGARAAASPRKSGPAPLPKRHSLPLARLPCNR